MKIAVADRYAMSLTNLDANQPGIIATQSTHKQLASFSQASQIHVKDSHIKANSDVLGIGDLTRCFCCTRPRHPSIRCSPHSMWVLR